MEKDKPLSEKMDFNLHHSIDVFEAKDVAEAVKKDKENIILALSDMITWDEYFNKRDKIMGEFE